MSSVRPDRHLRILAAGLVLAVLAASITACDRIKIPGRDQSDVPAETSRDVQHGNCLPTFGDGVAAADMSRDGKVILYLSDEQPSTWPEDKAWRATDRAVYAVRPQAVGEGGQLISVTHPIVTPWSSDPTDILPGIARDAAGRPVTAEPTVLQEVMSGLEMSASGGRFLLATARPGNPSAALKLYTGLVPADEIELRPGEGLTTVPINRYKDNEGITAFLLSDDGKKVAVLVGRDGELRVYDFEIIYTLDDKGNVVVTNDAELPLAATSLAVKRQPAVAYAGALHLAWSPTGDRLALAKNDSVGMTGVWLLDVASGKLEVVRSIANTTIPYVAWSTDGQSLFVLETDLSGEAGGSFGHSEVRRIEAKADGKDIGDRWQIQQQMGNRSAPADLTSFGDDARFLFVWEQQLWVLETPKAGRGNAEYGPLTRPLPDMRVSNGSSSGPLAVAPADETVTFLVQDDAGQHVGQRLYALGKECPLDPPTTSSTPDGAGPTAPAGEGGQPTVAPTPAGGNG